MTSHLTLNLNVVCLWVFFLIYCSTYSFLSNMGLRLTLGYPTIFIFTFRTKILWLWAKDCCF